MKGGGRGEFGAYSANHTRLSLRLNLDDENESKAKNLTLLMG